jgi:hypothetical protein
VCVHVYTVDRYTFSAINKVNKDFILFLSCLAAKLQLIRDIKMHFISVLNAQSVYQSLTLLF